MAIVSSDHNSAVVGHVHACWVLVFLETQFGDEHSLRVQHLHAAVRVVTSQEMAGMVDSKPAWCFEGDKRSALPGELTRLALCIKHLTRARESPSNTKAYLHELEREVAREHFACWADGHSVHATTAPFAHKLSRLGPNTDQVVFAVGNVEMLSVNGNCLRVHVCV